MSWRPIETAPKDGTRVDLWVRAQHNGMEFRQPDCGWNGDIEDWRSEQLPHPLSRYHWTPLFWMPLPPPPDERTEP